VEGVSRRVKIALPKRPGAVSPENPPRTVKNGFECLILGAPAGAVNDLRIPSPPNAVFPLLFHAITGVVPAEGEN